ncbi:hypothetical protein N2152v2_001288 [Parachlorella kessleri]
MRGVPDDCARHGFTAAVLAAAGYGPGSGVRVVHERAGLARGPTGETLPFPRLDMVVATVTVPQADRSLCRLPLAVEVGGAHLTFAVQHWLSPPVVRLASVPSARESPAPPRAAVLDRVGAAHGLTAQVRATGRAPIAEVAAQRAQPPGSRVGLGFPRPASVRAPLPPPDAPMTDALPTPPPPTVPLDEPIFGAATSYMQEHSDLQPEEIERVVLAFKTRHPTQYTASLGASTASSLPQAVRGPLHTLARVWFGERGGVSTPPGIVAIWEDVLPGEEGGAPAVLDRLGSAGGSLSRPTTSTSAATSAAPDLHSACRDGGQPSAQPTPMAIEGGCLHSPGPGGPPAPVMAQPQHAPQPASAPLRLLSLNVNGLREPAKRRTLFGEFQRGRWDVLCLQEAHTVSAQEVATWAQEGAGMGMPLRVGCFANALTSQSCGVVTLVKDTAPLTASRLATAPGGGRLLDVVLMYAGMELSVVNCYAPCSHEDRPAFFTEALAAALPPDRPVLACGDWNFVPGEADVVGVLGAGSHRQVGALQFEEVQVGHGLVDAWRHLHPDGPGVTHVAANGTGSSAARLDRWYVAAPLLPWVRACDIVHGLPGDHLGVELVLQPPVTLPCGKGRWRLPLPLLQDKVYCTGVVDRVHGFLAAHPLQAGYDARQRWEGLKACLTQFSMAHTLHARAAATQQRRQLLQSVQAAQRAYSAHPTVPGLLHAYTAAQQRLQQHEAAAAGKRAAAASVLWHCYGEQPTKWFHSLGRKVMLHQPIPAVFDPLDREAPAADMSSPAGIATALQHASSFFSADSAGGLFRPVPTDPAAQAQLLEAVDKQLSEASAKRTLGPKEDGSLTTGEVEKVFPALPRGVSPGLDGLPYEFYLHFWGTLAEPFLAMANEALREGEGVEQQPDTPVLPRSMLVGLIVLIHKGGGKEARDLASYRPITLLNCDYRLLARVLCSRLAGPLGSVVDATQTAFLPGRWIGDNVLYHLEEVQYLLEADGMEGCVVLLDFEKAYDRVVRGWIYQVMQRMAFPEPAVRWVRIMLAGTVARVSLNGHYTAPFPVRCSVQQGSPLSTVLFNITVQPLAAHLRQRLAAGALHGIPLPDGSLAPPSHQHADDTSLHLRSPGDVAVALAPVGSVGLHCRASGARLNPSKSNGLRVGPHPERDPVTGVCAVSGVLFPPPQAPIRHLGIFLSTDPAAGHAKSFAGLLHGVRETAALWRQHHLSWLGRAYVAEQVLASKVTYHATFVPPEASMWARITHVISAFVAGSGVDGDGAGGGGISHPAQHVCSLPWEEGGVALVDPSIQAECLQAKVAARLLQPGSHPWKVLMQHRLHRALPSLGPAVLVSGMHVTLHQLRDRRLLGYVRGFQRTQPHRLVLPDALSAPQVLNERLCYNRQVLAGGQPLQPRHFPALAEAGTWTVQQLAALVHPQQPLPPPLQLVWDCLPADWRATALQPWQPEWELCAVAGLVRQVESGKLYSVCAANGGMEEAPDAALPLGALWVPCCVGFKHLPRQRQGGGGAASDSGSDSGSDSDSDSGAQESRRVPLLVGPWELVQVDPNAWGWGKKDLLAFTVKSASVRRVQLRALRCLPGGRYQPKSGCRPKLWGPPPPPPGSPVPPTGLVVLETGWRHSYDTQPPGSGQRGVRRPAAEFEVGLLPCQAPGRRARLGVWERVSARHAAEPQPVPPSSATLVVLPDDTIDAAAPGDPDSAERCLWVEMRRADLPREQYIVLYRILHGSMYVGAFLHHISVIPRQQACCSHPACQGELETLSHAFTLCPAVAPAAAWVGRVIAAVAACPTPPPAPEVLLVGNGGGWVAPGDAHQVWLLLRGSFLHAVWQLRCRRSLTGQPFTALAVCAATVASVTSTLRRDWARVTQSLIGMSGMCPEWFRGRSPELALHAFRSRWAHRGVLCRVREGEGDAQPTIQLRFTLAHPCAPSPLASAPAVLPEPPPVQIGGPTA